MARPVVFLVSKLAWAFTYPFYEKKIPETLGSVFAKNFETPYFFGVNFETPYFFPYKFGTPYFTKKNSDPNESYLAIIIKWWSWCRGFWAIYQNLQMFAFVSSKKWKFWKKKWSNFEIDMRPLNFSPKNLRPLILLSENLRPLKKHSGRVQYSPLIMSSPLKSIYSLPSVFAFRPPLAEKKTIFQRTKVVFKIKRGEIMQRFGFSMLVFQFDPGTLCFDRIFVTFLYVSISWVISCLASVWSISTKNSYFSLKRVKSKIN